MSNPELPWKLLDKEDGVWLHYVGDSRTYAEFDGAVLPFEHDDLLNLGPKDKVMEAMCQFLIEQDFGELMERATADRAYYEGVVAQMKKPTA